jgi:hypothetical protein
MDLMVREGMKKMGTPNGKIDRIDLDLVEKLEQGRIEVSPKGVAWYNNCIILEMPTISVQGHTLSLNESHRYALIWTKMPFSDQLLEGISRQT